MEMLWRRRESLILNLQTNDDDDAAKKNHAEKFISATRLFIKWLRPLLDLNFMCWCVNKAGIVKSRGT